jgi:putative SOS response-associated peptidase YedK
MCGRFALDQSLDELMDHYAHTNNRFPQVTDALRQVWAPRWNIAPTSTIPIVIERAAGVREIGPARWSLIPSWSPTAALAYPTFNARSETAGEKPTFRDSLNHRRCLIPATAFYEWKGDKGHKTPHVIRRADSRVFSFAGLYSWWTDPENDTTIATTTILTMDSAHAVHEVHHRMPVFITQDFYDEWLDPSVLEGKNLIATASSMAVAVSADLVVYPVAPLVGDGPHLVVEAQKG